MIRFNKSFVKNTIIHKTWRSFAVIWYYQGRGGSRSHPFSNSLWLCFDPRALGNFWPNSLRSEVGLLSPAEPPHRGLGPLSEIKTLFHWVCAMRTVKANVLNFHINQYVFPESHTVSCYMKTFNSATINFL